MQLGKVRVVQQLVKARADALRIVMPGENKEDKVAA